jgi:hypothetical protein
VPRVSAPSLGGFLALDLASKEPDLPGQLIIVDAYPSLGAIFRPEVTPELAKSEAAMMRKFMTTQPSVDRSPFQTRRMK